MKFVAGVLVGVWLGLGGPVVDWFGNHPTVFLFKKGEVYERGR